MLLDDLNRESSSHEFETRFVIDLLDYYPDSKWKPYVWTFSLLAASTVGYMRYESGSHFPSDILVGAVVGGAVGYVVPLLHKTDDDKFSIVPEGSGFQLRFTAIIIDGH